MVERAEYLGPPLLEVAVPLHAPFYHNLDSPLRLRPCQRRLEGGARVEERVGGWQRDSLRFWVSIYTRKVFDGTAFRQTYGAHKTFPPGRVLKQPFMLSLIPMA